jgi:hypothetical protein
VTGSRSASAAAAAPSLPRCVGSSSARDDGTCCFPGCEHRRRLEAHHRHHWAHGGETSLENLTLLCYRHHRLVHEGGYTIEADAEGRIRFRNRHGVVWPLAPPRPPPGRAQDLLADNQAHGLQIDRDTNRNANWGEFDLACVVAAVSSAFEDDPSPATPR